MQPPVCFKLQVRFGLLSITSPFNCLITQVWLVAVLSAPQEVGADRVAGSDDGVGWKYVSLRTEHE